MKYFFGQYTGMNHLRHKKKYNRWTTWVEKLKQHTKNTILKVKYSILELEIDFKELKNTKIREIEKLFFKSINVSTNDMDKSGEKERMKKRPFAKNTCFDWYNLLINYIPESSIKNGWC